MTFPALALLEFHSIAAGIEAADAMVKRAPVEHILTGTIQPGYYLALVTGEVGVDVFLTQIGGLHLRCSQLSVISCRRLVMCPS